MVWATRKRPLITAAIEPELYRYIKAKTKSLDSLFHAIGGMPNHLHLIVSIPPRYAIADFVKRIKGSNSRHVNQTFPNQTFAWQQEYGVFSLGGKQLEAAIAYVQNQKQHHQNGNLMHGLEPEVLSFNG